MGGKKRQEKTWSLRSTSGHRDSVSPTSAAGNQTKHHAKAVSLGCMSGIFHLVSKYHTRRKFLTFGKKQEMKAPSKTNSQTTTTKTITCQSRDDRDSLETTKRSSVEAPRSPVLRAEIRSSGSANSPRVVACLMGIESIIPPASPLASVVAESAAEKRRKLLGALEKCDEDLKTLKKIIDAVRESQTPVKAVDGGGEKREKVVEEKGGGGKEEEEREEEPSPVSVFDFHHQQELLSPSPPLTGHSKRTRYGQVLQQHHIQKEHKPKATRKLKLGEEYNITTLTSVFLPAKPRPPLIDTARRTPAPTLVPWSKTVVESVEGVCRDVELGQTREVGCIVLLIQDFIVKDLVEEITNEMMIMKKKRSYSFDCAFGSSRIVSFPFQAYKRKLCYF